MTTALFIIGLAATVAGLALIAIPAAAIALGLALMAVAVLLERGATTDPDAAADAARAPHPERIPA